MNIVLIIATIKYSKIWRLLAWTLSGAVVTVVRSAPIINAQT